MSFDVVALCERQPTPDIILAAMVDAGPELRVDVVEGAKLIQLYALPARLMMTTEGARLVQVPGEVRRLLGIDTDIEPVWWVETHAPPRDPAAAAVARRFATSLVSRTGGILWTTT